MSQNPTKKKKLGHPNPVFSLVNGWPFPPLVNGKPSWSEAQPADPQAAILFRCPEHLPGDLAWGGKCCEKMGLSAINIQIQHDSYGFMWTT